MAEEIVIEVKNVSKKFSKNLKKALLYGFQDMLTEIFFMEKNDLSLREGEFWALKDINFTIKKGEMMGLAGLNGAGKSTLLKLINGLFKPDSGEIKINGRIGALIELGTGFNPVLSGRENIYINASILGMTKREINEKIEEIINFSELNDFIDAPIKTYSSGMLARLGFSVAVHLEPDILLIDEILSVGDATFREKSFRKLMGFKKNGGTIILVSHLARNIENYCDNAVLLEKGNLIMKGPALEVMEEYQKRTLEMMLQKNKMSIAGMTSENENDMAVIKACVFNKEEPCENKISYGKEITITIDYLVLKNEISKPSFAITIYKNEASVANLDMNHLGIEIESIKGNGQIICSIKEPNLSPGMYDVMFYVIADTTSAQGKKYYYSPAKVCSFAILPGVLKDKYINATSYGLYKMEPPVILNYMWNLANSNIKTENK